MVVDVVEVAHVSIFANLVSKIFERRIIIGKM